MNKFSPFVTNPLHQEGKLYEQVANQVAGLIEQGILRLGERIPSVRNLHRQLGVSLSTVLQAYLLLEDQGLIEARPRSGYYVKARLHKLPPKTSISSLPLTATGINEVVKSLLSATYNPHIIPLGVAFPGAELFPTLKLNRFLSKVSRRLREQTNSYGVFPGDESLRHQLARRSLDWSSGVSSKEIVTTAGCMEALNLCLRAVAKPGSTIAIESPTYYGILLMIESLGMKVLEVPTDQCNGVSLKHLEVALKQKQVNACLFTLNFNNPLGNCMPDEHKKQLVEMLARHQIPLIENDLLGDLYFGSRRPCSAKVFDKEGLVLFCSSFSKTLAPSYRVGWCAPGRYQEQVEYLKFLTSVTTSSLTQMVVAEFLQSGGYDQHLRHIRKAYSEQVQRVLQAVDTYFPTDTQTIKPTGGFVLWVQLPKLLDSLKLQRLALTECISIAPGTIFSSNGEYHNFIRLNCGNPWSPVIEQGLITLGRLVTEMGCVAKSF
jgi:DNA-binding transcriptional MocR family regulator